MNFIEIKKNKIIFDHHVQSTRVIKVKIINIHHTVNKHY